MNEAFLMKRLSFLIRAGMPLVSAITVLAAQTGKRRSREMLERVATHVEGGQPLAASFAEEQALGDFSIAVIRVGEESGSLSENLAYLAEELEKKSQLRAQVIGALIYPALIACATVALTAGLILFIFPKILPVFQGLDVPLPLTTRTVLFVNDYLRHWGLITLASLACVGIAFAFALKRSQNVRMLTDRILLHTPFVGGLIQAYCLGNSARTLALLLESGMTLRDALPATGSVVRHSLYQAEFAALAEGIEQGADLASRLRTNNGLFPDIVAHMVSVGESSGALTESLRYLAQYYANDVEERTKRLSSLAEPALMIGMGCVVGFVAISMITPMYEITQHLNAR